MSRKIRYNKIKLNPRKPTIKDLNRVFKTILVPSYTERKFKTDLGGIPSKGKSKTPPEVREKYEQIFAAEHGLDPLVVAGLDEDRLGIPESEKIPGKDKREFLIASKQLIKPLKLGVDRRVTFPTDKNEVIVFNPKKMFLNQNKKFESITGKYKAKSVEKRTDIQPLNITASPITLTMPSVGVAPDSVL